MFANIEPLAYHLVMTSLFNYCLENGLILTYPTPGDILDACENPKSIVSMKIGKKKIPAAQTGQMGLEYKLGECIFRKYENFKGLFSVNQSHRNEDEADIIPGRHLGIFPLFECEFLGDFDVMFKFIEGLLLKFGFPPSVKIDYNEACKELGVKEITANEETELYLRYGPVIALCNFPESANPFWNMKRENGKAKKVDFLLFGVEVFGCAERSNSTGEMIDNFFNVENGEYSKKLFELFGKKAVLKSLTKYLSNPVVNVVRSGFGMGITRFIQALNKLQQVTDAKTEG